MICMIRRFFFFPVLGALWAAVLAAGGPALAQGGSTGKARPKQSEAVQANASTEFLESLEGTVSAYSRAVEGYTSDPFPEPPWYTRDLALKMAEVGAGPTFQDQQLRSALEESIRTLLAFQKTHGFVVSQADTLMKQRKGPLIDIDRYVVAGLAMTLSQQFTQWKKAHDVLQPIVRQRYGRLVPTPSAPPYLLRLRELAKPAPVPSGKK